MSLEQFSNNPQTTLNGSIDNLTTTVLVASSAGFPSVPQFRIIIDSEIMLVTALAGNTWTVTRGGSLPAPDTTTTVAHNNAATVTHILTAGGLTNFVNNPIFNGAAWATTNILTLTPSSGNYGLVVNGPSGAGTSFGINTNAGTNSSDYSARFRTQANTDILGARGDGSTVIFGNLVFSPTVALIIPGATSISLRNRANSADNFIITDVGLATMRNALLIPSSAGATLPVTSYGSVPVKIDDQLLSGSASSITFVNPLPAGFRHLMIEWYARGDTAAANTAVNMRFNNISTATYDIQVLRGSGGSASSADSLGQTFITLGNIPANSATANYFGQGWARINHYNSTVGNKLTHSQSIFWSADTTGTEFDEIYGGKWRTTGTAVSRIDLLPGAGNFVSGSLFTLWGIP